MTDYQPRGSQDQNSFYTNPHTGMSHYSSGSGVNYFYNNGQIQYSTVNGSYPSYSAPYSPAQNGSSTSMYIPATSSMAMQYQNLPPTRCPIPQQPRIMSYAPYQSSTLPTQRQAHPHPRVSLGAELNLNPMADIESQDSINQDTMLSEPMVPPLDGYPNVKEFDELMKRYVSCKPTLAVADMPIQAMSPTCPRRNKTRL
jgi:hypothetical protein